MYTPQWIPNNYALTDTYLYQGQSQSWVDGPFVELDYALANTTPKGTGLLAILAELAGGGLALNELAETRADLLDHLFPNTNVTRFDAAQIDDHLDVSVVPNVVLMNPPFSVMANVDRRMADATLRHVASALSRLCGRRFAVPSIPRLSPPG